MIRLRRFQHFPSAILSPVGSSFPRKEPPAESIARFMARVVRIPTAAKPPKHPNLPSLEGRETACGGGVPLEAPQAGQLF